MTTKYDELLALYEATADERDACKRQNERLLGFIRQWVGLPLGGKSMEMQVEAVQLLKGSPFEVEKRS